MLFRSLKENGITDVEPLMIGLWAIPTAICALIIHLIRLSWLDAQIARDVQVWQQAQAKIQTDEQAGAQA